MSATTDRQTLIETAVRHLGGYTATAMRLGVTENCVRGWKAAGHVPAARAIHLEAILGIPARDLSDVEGLDDEGQERSA